MPPCSSPQSGAVFAAAIAMSASWEQSVRDTAQSVKSALVKMLPIAAGNHVERARDRFQAGPDADGP